jgi:hypothetical protein
MRHRPSHPRVDRLPYPQDRRPSRPSTRRRRQARPRNVLDRTTLIRRAKANCRHEPSLHPQGQQPLLADPLAVLALAQIQSHEVVRKRRHRETRLGRGGRPPARRRREEPSERRWPLFRPRRRRTCLRHSQAWRRQIREPLLPPYRVPSERLRSKRQSCLPHCTPFDGVKAAHDTANCVVLFFRSYICNLFFRMCSLPSYTHSVL